MAQKKVLFFGLFILYVTTTGMVGAKENTVCDNRFLTLVNPVRGRNLWSDKTIKPLEGQYAIIASYNYSATWLLQYDALTDKEIPDFVGNNFNKNQEIGLFLEISPDLATSARIIYPPQVPWYKPQAVFLSGYPQSERKKLIDTTFNKFREVFGYYPVSIGAWWIDSYSLEYMKDKYGIKTVLIVADQKTTDNYGVWGQWWGVAYYPSMANILVPAQNEKSKQDVVVLQWAQRDISKAYGEGTSYSNYSLQANDYAERELDTAYFKQLVSNYLSCDLPVGQITVGLETGIESVKSFPEYRNQLEALSKIEGLRSVTMDEFSNRYRNIYISNPEKTTIRDNVSEWVLTPQGRENKYLGDKIIYQNDLAFADYFSADKTEFLDRRLPIVQVEPSFTSPYFVIIAFVAGFIIYRRYRLTKYYWYVSFFILVSFLTTLLDYSKFGRYVYFGPVIGSIAITQLLVVVISFLFFIPLLKFFTKRSANVGQIMLYLPLAYAIDFILSILRYTRLHGQHYFGFAWDPLRFVGIQVTPKSLTFINQDFPSIIAGALLKFDFNIIWNNNLIAFVIYPLVHLVLGLMIYIILNKLPKIIRYVAIIILLLFFCFYIYNTLTLDPRIVL